MRRCIACARIADENTDSAEYPIPHLYVDVYLNPRVGYLNPRVGLYIYIYVDVCLYLDC